MWSAVHRTDRTIFELCATNMLVEAWHHVLKGKFLHNKRNRRIDHLLSTLLTEVLPYYALKQRRQDLGFEGIDIEVKKRQDIVKRSKQYTKDEISRIDAQRFRVLSKTDPTRAYEVDISTYTCHCLDFPSISFCKHICAVQILFEDELNSEDPEGDSESTSVSDTEESQSPELLPQAIVNPRRSRPIIVILAEKLERLAARLRRPRAKDPGFPSFSDFHDIVDNMLAGTDDSTILPSAQHVGPNANGWRQTQEAMGVLPKVKTRMRKAGDAAYGGGATSGSKAKKAKNNEQPPILTPTLPVAPPPASLPPSGPPQSAMLLPAYPYYYYPNIPYYHSYPQPSYPTNP
ncbi:hypothetical protein B0H16DRAFT_1551332 [Mycena metata]|uniref:SWIM-type domain-containing protein n=1 Tax=Mycena metata TaxID=1033252 RepID=A0AAD7IV68_9AGAR|nr:hypothetical protein B0H16DRAFT_1551332 [Mycena metata]